MSTCSTATSARRGRGHECRRRPTRDVGAVHGDGGLEPRLRELERDWDAYKTSRSATRRRHRRSRSATGTPSSAVMGAAEGDICALLRCSPRRLFSSLQRAGSTDSDGAATVKQGKAPAVLSYEEDASSVCSVEAGYSMAAAASSCSCNCQCAVRCCGYSTCSSCSIAATSSFSSGDGGVVGEHARKRGEGSWVAGNRFCWFTAIALPVVGIAAMVVLELVGDEGCSEFIVPT